MWDLIKRAIAYRVGSVMLSFLVIYYVTGELAFALELQFILLLTHTVYYTIFHGARRQGD